jgi:hypothetical protein
MSKQLKLGIYAIVVTYMVVLGSFILNDVDELKVREHDDNQKDNELALEAITWR